MLPIVDKPTLQYIIKEAKKGLYEAKENYEKPKPPTSPNSPIWPESLINPNLPIEQKHQ